jgi:hypothetical protein
MGMKLTVCVATALLILLPATLGGQQQETSILVGGTRLVLDMDEQRAVAALVDEHEVSKTDNLHWMVRSKYGPRRDVAQLRFLKGRLTYVRKYWTPDDQQQAAPMASALYGALRQLVLEGHRTCQITTSSDQNPKSEYKTAVIDCGVKQINLTVFRERSVGEVAMLDEVMESLR